MNGCMHACMYVCVFETSYYVIMSHDCDVRSCCLICFKSPIRSAVVILKVAMLSNTEILCKKEKKKNLRLSVCCFHSR